MSLDASDFGCSKVLTCPVCGFEFFMENPSLWVYKIKFEYTNKNGKITKRIEKKVCSWHCQRAYEKAHPSDDKSSCFTAGGNKAGKPPAIRNPEEIQLMLKPYMEGPHKTLRQISIETGLSETTIRKYRLIMGGYREK